MLTLFLDIHHSILNLKFNALFFFSILDIQVFLRGATQKLIKPVSAYNTNTYTTPVLLFSFLFLFTYYKNAWGRKDPGKRTGQKEKRFEQRLESSLAM